MEWARWPIQINLTTEANLAGTETSAIKAGVRGSRGGVGGRSGASATAAGRRACRRAASGLAAARVVVATAATVAAMMTPTATSTAAATTIAATTTATRAATVTGHRLVCIAPQEGDTDNREENRDSKQQCTIHSRFLQLKQNRYVPTGLTKLVGRRTTRRHPLVTATQGCS
jgi:hypothetical protein